MASVTRNIGLSLGADLCWPICYEEILRRMDLNLRVGRDTVRFRADRVTIEPYDLRQGCGYDLVIDRLTHWYHTSREWIKKAILMDDLYVLNNPWAIQSMEKHTTYCAMMHLGLPVPDTWMIPPKAYEPREDLEVTLARYAKMFDLAEIGSSLGYPMYMKPFDGGAWQGVSRISGESELREAYEGSGTRLMHLQRSVEPHDLFVRMIGVGPQVRAVKYDPSAPLHSRYTMEADFLSAGERSTLADMTLTINSFFTWDFNSCEALRGEDGVFRPIDFANACPDSQVTSLHGHFPWLIKAILRWSIFCAATRRPMRRNQDWDPYFKIARRKVPFEEKLQGYAALARRHFDTGRFEEFCATHLSGLDAVAHEFFGCDVARDAVRQKVAALYPESEVEEFTAVFWGRIQDQRARDAASGESR